MRGFGKKIETDQRKKRKKGYSLVHYYLVGYFLVLFIPLLICCIYYSRVIAVISEDDRAARKQELSHAAVLMDTMLDEFAYLGDSLATNQSVNEFKWVKSAFEYPNSYQINRLQENLPDLYQINQSVFDYFVFFNECEMVINKRIAYEYEDFYELYLKSEDSTSYQQWYEEIKNGTKEIGLHEVQSYCYKQKENKEMLVYSRPLLLNSGIADNSTVLIYVESSVIDTLMPTIFENGGVFITNGKNKIIYQKSEDEKLCQEMYEQAVAFALEQGYEKNSIQEYEWNFEKEDYLTVRLESEKSGLIYYMLVSKSSINQRRTSAIMSVVFCVSCAAFVGVLISWHLSNKSAVSVNSILKEISKETEYYENHSAVFSRLKTTYRELLRNNSALADAINEQKPFMRNAFINRLLYEGYSMQAEVEKIAESLQIDYMDKQYCVILFQFCAGYIDLIHQNVELMGSCAISLMEVIEYVLPGSLYVNIGDEQVALIMDYRSEETMEFREVTEKKIQRIREELPANIADKMFIYGGNLVEKLTGIHESFKNASYMFRKEKEQIENSIIWYVGDLEILPLYPSQDMEIKLTHYVTAGDEKGLHDELERLMKNYIIENNLPVYLQHMFLHELQIIMFRILGNIDMEEKEYWNYYEKLEENYSSSFLEQITRTLGIYTAVCHYVSEQKEELDVSNLMPSVVAYIDVEYGNAELSLSSVADIFGISEPYLSTVFKEVMGVNFSAYLEGVRIDKAKDLLRSTKMLVGEISENVGYYSTNSFCRAFKRVTGSSASEYRKETKK